MGTFSRTILYIHDSRFRKNYALISHERKRRILLFKSPPIHEFETTIRNIVFIVTINCIYYFIHFYKTSRCRRKVKRLIYKQPSILPIENSFRLENFVNITRTTINPERRTLRNREKATKKRRRRGRKKRNCSRNSLPGKSLRAQFSRRGPIETRFRPIHPRLPSPWRKIADSTGEHECATRGGGGRGARAACACGGREGARGRTQG